MSWLLPILKSKLAVLGAVLVVVGVIVFGGPRILGSAARPWCYLAGALVLVGYLVYVLFKKWQEKKKARMLEGFLNQQADDQLLSARPDVQDELAAIKEKLNRALQILKKSRLARGRRGAEALYVLPWYMIIGPSASGKSTAIRNSGLHFPPVDPDSDSPGKVKGLGGTRNCDWWFSNEGIILDTAGRYTLSANVQEDREEWTNFLRMLRKARPKAPINGLILAISIDELLRKDADGIEAHAQALRARVDELIIELEILFPVYLVFTKCDLLSGFVESFGPLSKSDREQVWGYTREYGPARGSLQDEYTTEVDELLATLERRRLHQLATETRLAQKCGAYLFPVEFAAAQPKLTAFIETLFRPNPYQQNPLLRGVYFTSGTQEGTPIAQVMAAMRREFALSGHSAASESPSETKAYFIRDLFQEIILPDEAQVYPTTRAWRRRRLFRGGAIAAQLLATITLSAFLVVSFGNNRLNNNHLSVLTKRIARATQGVTWFDLDRLDSLDVLRERLQAGESHVPLMSRWGLYSGDRVLSAARETYLKRLRSILMAPTATALARDYLGNAIDCEDTIQFNRQYTAFTVYQMLTLPADSIPNFPSRLKQQVLEIWKPQVPEDRRIDLELLVGQQVDYYWRHRREAVSRWAVVTPDRNLIGTVESQIGRCWTPHRLYQTIMDQISAELGGEYSYLDAVSATTRLDGGAVGRAFTREGWEQKVRPAIKNMPQRIADDPMLRDAFSDFTDDDIRKQITDFYVSDFIANWRAFVAGGSIIPFHDLNDAFAGIDELSQDPSPMIRLLEKVFDQSELIDSDGKRFPKIEAEFEKLGRFLGKRRNTDPTAEAGKDKYLNLMSTLPAEIQAIEQKFTSEARCANSLKQLSGNLDLKAQQIQRLLRGAGIATEAARLLVRPLAATKQAAAAGACGCLDREWKTKVWDQFNQELASSYPFNAVGGSEASPGQVEDFFTRTLKSFEQNEIEDATRMGIPISSSFRSAMNAAHAIQKVLARGGTAKIRFTLSAEAGGMSGIRRMQLSYSREPVWEYVMGQRQTREFRWPQPGGGDCDLRVEALTDGVYFQPAKFNGDWGIFHMFDQAKKSSNHQLVWTFNSAAGQTATVRLTLGGSDAAFIINGHFTQFRCPRTVCQ